MCDSICNEQGTAAEPRLRLSQLGVAMTSEEDRYADIEVDVLDDEGVRAVIDNALARAGCTWEELQEQAKAGSFSSEIARRAWFVVSSFEPSAA